MSKIFQTGDTVKIQYADESIAGTVILASGNGRSLMLSFDGLIDGHFGTMPVLADDLGVYRSLMTGAAVELTPVR